MKNRLDKNRRCLLNQVLLQLPARHCERAQGQGLVFELEVDAETGPGHEGQQCRSVHPPDQSTPAVRPETGVESSDFHEPGQGQHDYGRPR